MVSYILFLLYLNAYCCVCVCVWREEPLRRFPSRMDLFKFVCIVI